MNTETRNNGVFRLDYWYTPDEVCSKDWDFTGKMKIWPDGDVAFEIDYAVNGWRTTFATGINVLWRKIWRKPRLRRQRYLFHHCFIFIELNPEPAFIIVECKDLP